MNFFNENWILFFYLMDEYVVEFMLIVYDFVVVDFIE